MVSDSSSPIEFSLDVKSGVPYYKQIIPGRVLCRAVPRSTADGGLGAILANPCVPATGMDRICVRNGSGSFSDRNSSSETGRILRYRLT